MKSTLGLHLIRGKSLRPRLTAHMNILLCHGDESDDAGSLSRYHSEKRVSLL